MVDLPLFAAVVPWSKLASEKVGSLLGSLLHFPISESMVARYIYFTYSKLMIYFLFIANVGKRIPRILWVMGILYEITIIAAGKDA